MQAKEITQVAINVSQILGFKKSNRNKCDQLFEQLSQYGITIDPLSDKDWAKYTHNLTRGHCDPWTGTIRVSEQVFDMACEGERDALFVMLHELGHLLLGHKVGLHNATTEPTKSEDAEWQADYFAEQVLLLMGYRLNQLSFDFYM